MKFSQFLKSDFAESHSCSRFSPQFLGLYNGKIMMMHTNHVLKFYVLWVFSMVPDDLNTWMPSWTDRLVVHQSRMIILSACGLVLSTCWHLSKQPIRDSEFILHVRVVHVFTSMCMCVLKDLLAVLPGVCPQSCIGKHCPPAGKNISPVWSHICNKCMGQRQNLNSMQDFTGRQSRSGQYIS